MSRRCMVTGKMQMTGNKVSHAQNKSRRTFRPNVKDQGVYSEVLGKMVRIRVSANGMRTIEHKGGLDTWLATTAKTKLDPALRPVKVQIENALAAKKAPKPVRKTPVGKKPAPKKKVSGRSVKKAAAKKSKK